MTANAVLRPSVASATPSIAAIAVSSDARIITTRSDTHQAPSVPAVDPWASTAGRNAARNTACSANEMIAARIAQAAVRLRCTRTRRGSHVSTVATVPARHSAPATDAPPKNPPSTKKKNEMTRAPSAVPAIHQSRIIAGWC